MLVDTQYNYKTKKLIVSYVDEQGDIKLKYYNWNKPQGYVTCSPMDADRHPTYTSWDNQPVKMVDLDYPNRYSIYEFLDTQIPEAEREEIFKFNVPKIYFIDIETEILPEVGFPKPEDTPGRVLAISIVYDDKVILLGLEDMPTEMQTRIKNGTNKHFKTHNVDYKLKYVKYDSEFDLLHAFFNKMVPKMPCMTGWNFTNYDWKYLVNRARKMSKLGPDGREMKVDPAVSSFTGKLSTAFGAEYEVPAHRLIFDYMQLYKCLDTSIKVKESNSLEFVSSKLCGMSKIPFKGSLQELYEQDWEKYMLYNSVDSVLVQRIHEARNYISIIFAISSLARIKAMDVVSQVNNALGSIAITEGVLRNRYRNERGIVLFRDENKRVQDYGEESIEGGYVMDPIPGMNRYVETRDFSSLYPTSQRMWFISPETYAGKTVNNETFINGNPIDKTTHVICTNGNVFRKEMSPTLKMLNDVYVDRKIDKKKMLAKKAELQEVNKKIKALEDRLAMAA